MAGRKKNANPTPKPTTKEERAEYKKQAFRRLGIARTVAAVKRIQLVKNVAKYPHTPEQGQKILNALYAAVQDVEKSFGANQAEQVESFDL